MIIIIGIGGASCSGKTILAKHLKSVLPGAVIVHQDDFAPPADQVPYSPIHPELQDWDDPQSCIDWQAFRQALRDIRAGQEPTHESIDHLNKQVEVEIDPDVRAEYQHRFESVKDVVWHIVDGFVMYWDKIVVDHLDVKLFLQVPYDLLKARREARRVYVLQSGDAWVDPPDYFDKIVYPAYLKAHRDLPADVYTLESNDMTATFAQSCEAILKRCREK